MKSIGDCLAALVKVGQIDKKTAEQAQKLFDDIKAGTAGAAGTVTAEANAALRAAEAMKRAAEDKKFQAVLNARTLDETTKRVMADPHSRAVGAAQIFQRFEVSGKSGGVNSDVGARFINHPDDAHRDALLTQYEAVGQTLAAHYFAHGVRKRRHVPSSIRYSSNSFLGEEETVKQSLPHSTLAPSLHISSVRLDNLWCCGLQSIGNTKQQSILGAAGSLSKAA